MTIQAYRAYTLTGCREEHLNGKHVTVVGNSLDPKKVWVRRMDKPQSMIEVFVDQLAEYHAPDPICFSDICEYTNDLSIYDFQALIQYLSMQGHAPTLQDIKDWRVLQCLKPSSY